MTLGETEAADAENRTRWLQCIEVHTVWLKCAEKLIEGGYLMAPMTQSQEKGITDE